MKQLDTNNSFILLILAAIVFIGLLLRKKVSKTDAANFYGISQGMISFIEKLSA